MRVVVLPLGEPGIFRSLLLPETADALAAGEPITAFGLIEEDIAIGAIAGYLRGSVFRISSLYVAPDYRREGGGWMLMDALTQVIVNHAVGIEISFTITREEHRTLQLFLEAVGFVRKVDDGNEIYITTLDNITASSFWERIKISRGTSFSRISSSSLHSAELEAWDANAPIPKGGLSARTVDKDVSVAALKSGKVEAYVVFENTWAEGLTLSAVWSKSTNPLVLPGLLRYATEQLTKKYPRETSLVVQTVNDASAAMVRAIIPEAKEISCTYQFMTTA